MFKSKAVVEWYDQPWSKQDAYGQRLAQNGALIARDGFWKVGRGFILPRIDIPLPPEQLAQPENMKYVAAAELGAAKQRSLGLLSYKPLTHFVMLFPTPIGRKLEMRFLRFEFPPDFDFYGMPADVGQ